MKIKKSILSRAMAAMLAMVLCLAMSVSAFAGTGGTKDNPQKAILTKTLQYANNVGLTTPTVTFSFDFAAQSFDGDETGTGTTGMPSIGTKTITIDSTSTTDTSGTMVKVSGSSSDVLNAITSTDWAVKGTGVYKYTVTESASGFTAAAGSGETMNYSKAQYTLVVVIAYDSASDTYYVEQTKTVKDKDDLGDIDGGKGDPNDPAGNDYNFIFTNTYTKDGGSIPSSNSLKISKAVSGTDADTTKAFTYTLIANDSVTGIAAEVYSGTITRADSTTETVSLTANGTTTVTFTLSDGEYVIFNDLPVGTTFTVTESGASGYKAQYTEITGTSGTSSASSTTVVSSSTGADLSTGSKTIGQIDNTVAYTNTYDNSLIPTGVLSNIAPFVAIIAVAVLAFVAFAAMNRRKASR